jgi:prepilin-type N-terminal cleavage/methylation domain-containing protein
MPTEEKSKVRKAFTLVELIFVIIVIAILAVVALPKLAATRDDAKLTMTAHNVMVAAGEIAAYAVAKGHTTSSLSQMSDGIRSLVNASLATDTGNYEAIISAGSVGDCLRLKIENPGANTETLKLLNGNGGGGECSRLRQLIDPASFPLPLRGSRISL